MCIINLSARCRDRNWTDQGRWGGEASADGTARQCQLINSGRVNFDPCALADLTTQLRVSRVATVTKVKISPETRAKTPYGSKVEVCLSEL